MSVVAAADGVKLHVESSGAGTPIVFIHEFGGSCRAFDLQVAAMSPRHRCVTFNARGYPPSDVPPQVDAYSQDIAASDVVAVLDGLDIERAHLVGVSMGAAAALQVCLKHPERVRSATLASIGTGSDAKPGEMQAGMEAMARMIESQGLENLALSMGNQPARRKLKDKHPAQFAKFTEEVRALSSQGMANTMRGVQKRRPPVYAHEAQLSVARMPILVVLGGDDAACKGPSEFLAKQLPAAQLEVFPGTGHLVNIEEAGRFNELVLGLVGNVDGIG